MTHLALSSSYVDAYLASKNVTVPICLSEAHESLQNKTCMGADFLGWIDLPRDIQESLADIQKTADTLQAQSDVLIVCGIGGSYLGARAVIEALQSPLSGTEIVFLGNHLSGSEYEKVFQKYAQKSVSACIISKSGTTLETAISYRLVRAFLLSKYSEAEVQERIVTITDAVHGALRAETTKQGYKSYILPGDIGGRYSVLTAAGLLPIAVAGIDIEALVEGAREAQNEIQNTKGTIQNEGILEMHPAFLYAEKRVQLERSGFVSELFITSEPSLYFMGEWWKQLMGESHGKE